MDPNLNQSEKCESANSNTIHQVLDSFYSDIASIEATFSTNSNDVPEETSIPPVNPVLEEQPEHKEIDNVPSPKVEEKVVKKKKKVRIRIFWGRDSVKV